LLIEVDFNSSRKAVIEPQKYSPYELGLGRLVSLDKARFVGHDALMEEQKRGHEREIMGLEIDWNSVEKLYEHVGLAPAMPATASRIAVPVYKSGPQIGKATSTRWSPSLKRLIALATIAREHAKIGSAVEMEITVEAVCHRVPATIAKIPFFNPKRKTAIPV